MSPIQTTLVNQPQPRQKELFFALCHDKIKRHNTDDWKSYSKMLPPSRHRISKKVTQRIERQNLNFRTHIKRLNRPNDMLLKIRDHARCGDKNLRVPHQFKEATLLGHDQNIMDNSSFRCPEIRG